MVQSTSSLTPCVSSPLLPVELQSRIHAAASLRSPCAYLISLSNLKCPKLSSQSFSPKAFFLSCLLSQDIPSCSCPDPKLWRHPCFLFFSYTSHLIFHQISLALSSQYRETPLVPFRSKVAVATAALQASCSQDRQSKKARCGKVDQ